MPVVKEVHSQLQELLNHQGSFIETLRNEKDALANDQQIAEERIQDCLKEFIPDSDVGTLSRLSGIAEDAGTDFNFTEFAQSLKEDLESRLQEADNLENKYGKSEDIEGRLSDISKRSNDHVKLIVNISEKITELKKRRRSIEAHNEHFPDLQITPEIFDRFRDESIIGKLRGIFCEAIFPNSGYDSAAYVAVTYQGDYKADFEEERALGEQRVAFVDALQDATKQINKLQAAVKSIKSAREDRDNPDFVRESVLAEVTGMLKDERFLDAVAENMTPEQAELLRLYDFKLQILPAIEDAADKNFTENSQTLKVLREAVGKWGTLAKREPNAETDFDVEAVKDAIRLNQVKLLYSSISVESGRKALESFDLSAREHADNMAMRSMFMVHMIATCAVDPYYAHKIMGVDNTDGLRPDYQAVLSNESFEGGDIFETLRGEFTAAIGPEALARLTQELDGIDVAPLKIAMPADAPASIDTASHDSPSDFSM